MAGWARVTGGAVSVPDVFTGGNVAYKAFRDAETRGVAVRIELPVITLAFAFALALA